MIRILVAEDSMSARAMLVKILASDPEIRVISQAKDGVEAIEMTQKLRPDLVTMDIHMPRLGGLEATQEIMITAPTPIVIVTASQKARDIAESLDSLQVGALDVLLKPSMPGTATFFEEARHLVSVVKTMAKVKVRRLKPATTGESKIPFPVPSGAPKIKIVGIATSTGGPLALFSILSTLPADYPAPILVSHRITPGLTPGLASWLDAASPLRVKVADEGELLLPRSVYLASDGQHLGVSKQGTVALSVAPPIDGVRPSSTYMLSSIGRVFGDGAVAVMLTGEGKDGVEGLKVIREFNGHVIAQDETSSVVFDMPDAAISQGLTQEILPLEVIASRLVELL